jgi:hypothetical protein
MNNALLVEHLKNNSHLIFDEIRRWRNLLWDDYLDYKYRQNAHRMNIVPWVFNPLD